MITQKHDNNILQSSDKPANPHQARVQKRRQANMIGISGGGSTTGVRGSCDGRTDGPMQRIYSRGRSTNSYYRRWAKRRYTLMLSFIPVKPPPGSLPRPLRRPDNQIIIVFLILKFYLIFCAADLLTSKQASKDVHTCLLAKISVEKLLACLLVSRAGNLLVTCLLA
jgi:hypothetical protein